MAIRNDYQAIEYSKFGQGFFKETKMMYIHKMIPPFKEDLIMYPFVRMKCKNYIFNHENK
jgi:histidine ammonia-lyase